MVKVQLKVGVDQGAFLMDAEVVVKDALGLIDDVVADGTLRAEAMALATDIAMMFAGLNVVGMYKVVTDLNVLIATLQAEGKLQGDMTKIIADIQKLEADWVAPAA